MRISYLFAVPGFPLCLRLEVQEPRLGGVNIANIALKVPICCMIEKMSNVVFALNYLFPSAPGFSYLFIKTIEFFQFIIAEGLVDLILRGTSCKFGCAFWDCMENC